MQKKLTRSIIVVLMLVIVGCSSFPDRHQKKQYKKVQHTFKQDHVLVEVLRMVESDSAAMFFDDIKSLSLKKFIQKHRITEKTLDLTLAAMDLMAQLSKSLNGLNLSPEDTRLIIEKMKEKKAEEQNQ